MIYAAVFDMDGLLIDSEPLWKEAEKQVFSSVGVQVTEVLSKQTATMTTGEVTRFWYERNPWQEKSLEEVENAVVDKVEALIIEKGCELEGVTETLKLLKEKGFKIGLSTNSPYQLIPIILNKLGIASYFDAISSSDDVEQGKPEPDVYLLTINKLGVDSSNCIAFEDSYSGMLAATRANIKTVVIPQPDKFYQEFNEASLKLQKLSEFNESHLASLMDLNLKETIAPTPHESFLEEGLDCE
ncbi:hexitol phosphatase HxpB [Vibrio alginolyticus]|uniref:HAD family hydrolase n=1 Tax=Vibrio alginolyticus TaxID=663 RepID=A0A7H8DV74_VIBAL|nr:MULTISPECIES: hexitol phosphatase HxpB [Vibrio]MDW1811927.1 hexitol phosphatase HxpB [Vibrio sp. Vb2362]QCO88219.1 hexitol phosphatase HxpB [Vibrio neocaledonicus]ANP66934.1 HAD family hydrolase [Vibrio alginolyticus]EGQ8497773.1 hexitol phosphatase HxpB [Vibrio alginolyticus]EGQ9109945.1 hexitol phosphatase HxpB [Vibrio alginolyticus]